MINNKYLWFILTFILIIASLNVIKHPFAFYLPVNIPGKQMAATIPPFGIFIENDFKNEVQDDSCSIYTHEMVHWRQYKRLGLWGYYYQYLKEYLYKDRVNHWMEKEARKPCQGKIR